MVALATGLSNRRVTLGSLGGSGDFTEGGLLPARLAGAQRHIGHEQRRDQGDPRQRYRDKERVVQRQSERVADGMHGLIEGGASCGGNLAFAAAIFAGSSMAFGLLAELPMTLVKAGGKLTLATWSAIAPGSRWARMLPSTAELTVPPTLRQN